MSAEATERARIAYPRRYWYVACRSRELGRRPLARTLLGTPIVVFRGERGRPAALLDRCAHRNLPLSAGRAIEGLVECAYHGWRYDATGACRRVPALAGGPPPHGCSVASFPVTEHQGYVWVYADSDGSPGEPPYTFPYVGAPGYASVRFESEVEATLLATLENMLDVPHTGILHRGLFRSAPHRRIVAVARRFADRAEVEYLGEERPAGVLARLLAPGGGPVVHFDRFLLPSIAQVEYRLGDSHLVVTNAATPVDDFRTRFASVVSYRLPLPSIVVRVVLAPLARRVFRQDARILRLQTDAARRFGRESYRSTEVDLIGPHVWRLLKHAEAGPTPESGGPPEFEKRVELVV